jgi:hypothetical protein
MTFGQFISLTVLASVVAALIHGKWRAEVVALAGAAILLITRTVRPIEVQGAFASPALISPRVTLRNCLCDGAVGVAWPIDSLGRLICVRD